MARELTFQEKREFAAHNEHIIEALNDTKIIPIKKLDDIKRISRGNLVTISYKVETNETSPTLITNGIFHYAQGPRVLLATHLIVNADKELGIYEYLWLEKYNVFSFNSNPSHVILKPDSPIFKQYKEKLEQTDWSSL